MPALSFRTVPAEQHPQGSLKPRRPLTVTLLVCRSLLRGQTWREGHTLSRANMVALAELRNPFQAE